MYDMMTLIFATSGNYALCDKYSNYEYSRSKVALQFTTIIYTSTIIFHWHKIVSLHFGLLDYLKQLFTQIVYAIIYKQYV